MQYTGLLGTFHAAIRGSLILVAFSLLSSASDLRRTPIVQVVNLASPAVVNIHGQKTIARNAETNLPKQVNGMGTGVVIDPRGYILTNYHVVEGVRKIEIGFDDGTNSIARLIARDHQTDLAIIKIATPNHQPVIRVGTSSDLMKGEPVIAIGNAYGYEHTVTNGIISHLHRDVQVSDTLRYDDLIQTSASINPGNSGGPLLNIDGEMIGVNVAVRAGAQNIGFAIPVDKAMQVAARLMSIENLNGKWHGIHANEAGADGQPAVVKEVQPDSPASASGIRPGDAICRIGSLNISRALDIERAFLDLEVGEKVTVEVERDGQIKKLQLALAVREESANLEVDEVNRKTWELLGMEFAEIPPEDFAKRQTSYDGGLRIARIRANGPASAQGIRPGDILVGMLGWRTESIQDIHYIINRPNLEQLSPVKFYILREGDSRTLFGHLRFAADRGRRSGTGWK